MDKFTAYELEGMPLQMGDRDKPLTDEIITKAIQQLGLLKVQEIQQELVEGLRNGRPDGYTALRSLLTKIVSVS